MSTWKDLHSIVFWFPRWLYFIESGSSVRYWTKIIMNCIHFYNIFLNFILDKKKKKNFNVWSINIIKMNKFSSSPYGLKWCTTFPVQDGGSWLYFILYYSKMDWKNKDKKVLWDEHNLRNKIFHNQHCSGYQ